MSEKIDPDRDPTPRGSATPHGAEELLGFLREQDTRERVFEAYPDAVLILDADGTVTDMNRAAASLLGRTRDERVELDEILVEGSDRPRAATGGVWQGRAHVRRADGSTVEVAARSVVVPGESGALHLLVLTDREPDPVADALAAAEQRLAAIIDSATDAIVSVDERQRIVVFNAAAEAMFGWSASEIVGQPLERLIPERLREVHDEHVRSFATTGYTKRRMGALLGTLTGRRASGEEFPIEATISRVETPTGPTLTAIVRDISERLRLEEERRDVREAERRAWEEARRIEVRIARLQAITDAALVHLSLDDLFDQLLGRLRELLGADATTVLLVDPDERVLKVRAVSGLERPQHERPDVPIGVGVAGRIAAQARPVIIGDLGRVHAVSSFLGRRLRSLVGVPIIHRGEVRGVVHAGSVRPRRFTQEDVALLELVASRLAPAIENAALHETERIARATAEQDAARLRLVQSIAEVLGTVRPVEEIGRVVLDRVVPALGANAGALGLLEPDGRTVRIASWTGYDDDTIRRLGRFPLEADLPAADALRTRRIVTIGSRAERDERYTALAGAQTVGSSWAALPLIVGARPLGVITLSFPSERSFADDDLEVMSALAHQCAQALDRWLLVEGERASRARAEAVNRRLALLQALTARYSRALTSREVAEISVSEATGSLGARSGVVMLLDEDGMLEVAAAKGYDARALEPWRSFPADLPTPAGDAIRTGDVVVVSSASELADRYPLIGGTAPGRPSGPTAAMPILVDERPIGALAFTFDEGRRVDGDDRQLLQALGRQCGQAIERARLYENERRARRDAEVARDRTERLQEVATALAGATSEEEVFEVLAEQSIVALGAVAAITVRVSPTGDLEVAAVRGLPPDVVEAGRPIDPGSDWPVVETARSGVATWASSGDELSARYPSTTDTQERLGFRGAFAAVPLMSGSTVLGCVGIQFADRRDWPDHDREFLRAIAGQCTQALLQARARRAEIETRRELERSERRYRSLVQTASAIDWTVDPAGAFVEPQPSWAAYTGQPWEQHRGLGWLEAIHGDDRERILERWFAARDSGEMLTVLARLFHAQTHEYRNVEIHAAPVRDAAGRITEWVGTATDVHEQWLAGREAADREAAARAELETAGERLAYLAAASNVLASSLEERETLQRLADLAVPRLADWCAIDLVEDHGAIRLVAVAHVDPAKVELARDLRRRYPTDADAETGVPQVIRSGEPILVREIPPEMLDDARERIPDVDSLVEELQLRSLMIVPLSLGDRVLGAMSFVWAESGYRYDQDDLALAEDLAHRAAVAIENARLFAAERAARREQTRAGERLQLLSEAGAAMAETLDARRMLSALVRTLSRRFCDYAVVYRIDRIGELIDVVTAHRDLALDGTLHRAMALRFPQPTDEHSLVARVMRTGMPVWEPTLSPSFVDEIDVTDEQRAMLHRLDPASVIVVPLATQDRDLGILSLVRSTGSPPFVREDLDLAAELGRRAGSLLDNARLYSERELIADTLQRSLLPPDLPLVPGLEVGARYRSAAPGTTVGGDFYDVFEVDVEHWGALIGDVVGKGPQAAAMMALARYTIRTAAIGETRPSTILSTLNEAILRQMRDNMFCTACFARVRRDGEGARVTLAAGGHPLPILVRADGGIEQVGEPGTLLGVFDDPTLVDVAFDLSPGDALVMYTDGVVDERRGDEEFGERRLLELLAALAGADAQRIADAIDEAVAEFRSGEPKDDVAVLVVKVPA